MGYFRCGTVGAKLRWAGAVTFFLAGLTVLCVMAVETHECGVCERPEEHAGNTTDFSAFQCSSWPKLEEKQGDYIKDGKRAFDTESRELYRVVHRSAPS